MKKQTHIDKVRQENAQVKELIQDVLKIDNSQYCHFQEKMGYVYLETEMELDPYAIKELTYMRAFWNWWKLQWIKRDIQFLKDVNAIGTALPNSIYHKKEIHNTYYQYHKANSILFMPHKTTIRESYARFIGRVNKQVVNG